MYHRAQQVRREQPLLEEMLAVQKKIRLQKEKDMYKDDNRHKKYKKVFAPLTESIKRLEKTSKTPPPTVDDLLDLKDDPHTFDKLIEPEEEKEEEEEREEEEEEQQEEEVEEPGELYISALRAVPARYHDDGQLGLNSANDTIGDWDFTVSGNNLLVSRIVDMDEEETDSIEINDFNLWVFLLVKNPKSINLPLRDPQGNVLPYISRYAEIAKRLGLVERFEKHTRSRNRIKYKLIKAAAAKSGNGFLFTSKPPTLIHPDTVVIPSDRKGLLKSLFLALSEFRAGNTGMRNIVVPLAAEAKRKGILPMNLLTNDEKTWVFA